MTELPPWPYGPLESAQDVVYGSVRYVVQYTEDGYYGFAFRGKREVAAMIGPSKSAFACGRELAKAAPPGIFGNGA